jgi:TRAP transporter TAXI family solute receptor
MGSQPETWTLGTPAEGVPSNVAGKAAARVFNDTESPLQLQVQSYSGGEEALRLLGRGDIEMATGSNYLGRAANQSMNPFEGVDFSGDQALEEAPVQSMAYMDLRVFFVTLNQDIQTLSDLRGKSVNVGPPGAAWLSRAIFQAVGILGDVEIVTTGFSDVPFSLEEGRVDATIATASLGTSPTPYVQNMADYDINVVQYKDGDLQALNDLSGFSVNEAKVGQFFNSVDMEAMPAATQPFQFWINANADTDLAYEFAQQCFENRSDIQSFAGFLEEFSPEYAVDGLISEVPVHPGVARYYKENDLWRDDLTEAES